MLDERIVTFWPTERDLAGIVEPHHIGRDQCKTSMTLDAVLVKRSRKAERKTERGGSQHPAKGLEVKDSADRGGRRWRQYALATPWT